jgi:4-hydroxyproline epimerase
MANAPSTAALAAQAPRPAWPTSSTRACSPGDRFVHESYIGSRFIGKVEELVDLDGTPAILPSIEGSAVATGFNTIWIDRNDPFWAGFSVT